MARSHAAEEGTGLRRFARALLKGGSTGEQGAAGAADRAEVAPAAPEPGPGPAANAAEILADLCRWAVEISDEDLSIEELDPEAGIFDEGYVDSMSYVELLARVDERYGVAIPDEQVVGSSLGDLARYVAEESRA